MNTFEHVYLLNQRPAKDIKLKNPCTFHFSFLPSALDMVIERFICLKKDKCFEEQEFLETYIGEQFIQDKKWVKITEYSTKNNNNILNTRFSLQKVNNAPYLSSEAALIH